MCRWLGVSKSGFYTWASRGVSQRYLEDQDLLKKITKVFEKSDGRYGSPRIHQALRKQGIYVSRKRVERLMREAGMKGRVVRVTRRAPGCKKFHSKGENLLLAMDTPTKIDQVWVSDVTYLKVKGRWHYMATVMDLYSRRILGWSLSTSRTQELTCAAFKHAIKKRGYPRNILFHTDGGIEYRANDFQKLLKKYQFKHSVNRPRYCTDNAFMESFFHSLKTELIRGNTYNTQDQLRKDLSRYINKFYNSVRLHSGLDYMSPIEYENSVA